MTHGQFIQWLSGFSDAIDTVPTEKQWGMIKQELAHTIVKKDDSGIVDYNGIKVRLVPYGHGLMGR